jgi:hypothetical protein
MQEEVSSRWDTHASSFSFFLGGFLKVWRMRKMSGGDLAAGQEKGPPRDFSREKINKGKEFERSSLSKLLRYNPAALNFF